MPLGASAGGRGCCCRTSWRPGTRTSSPCRWPCCSAGRSRWGRGWCDRRLVRGLEVGTWQAAAHLARGRRVGGVGAVVRGLGHRGSGRRGGLAAWGWAWRWRTAVAAWRAGRARGTGRSRRRRPPTTRRRPRRWRPLARPLVPLGLPGRAALVALPGKLALALLLARHPVQPSCAVARVRADQRNFANRTCTRRAVAPPLPVRAKAVVALPPKHARIPPQSARIVTPKLAEEAGGRGPPSGPASPDWPRRRWRPAR